MNNKYEFRINFGSVSGRLDTAGETEAEAYEKMMEIVGRRLADAFPELDIEYDIECEEVWEGGDPDEAYDLEVDRQLGVI